jgi:hypothetical protein
LKITVSLTDHSHIPQESNTQKCTVHKGKLKTPPKARLTNTIAASAAAPRTISDFLRRPSHIDRGPQSRSTPRFVARPLHPPPPPSADSSRCRSRRRCPRARPACPSFVRPPPPSAPTSRTKCMQTVCADAIDLQQTQRLVHIELIEWRGGSTQRGTESRMRGRGLPGVPMRLSTRWVNVAGWCSGRGIKLTVEGWACRQHRATRYASIATLLPRAPRVFAAGRPRQRASANPD